MSVEARSSKVADAAEAPSVRLFFTNYIYGKRDERNLDKKLVHKDV